MHIRYSALFLSALLLSTDVYPYSACRLPEIREVSVPNRWKGKKVAFLGDSITDKIHVGTTKNYWQYLSEMLGLEPFVYGITVISGTVCWSRPGDCRPNGGMILMQS